MVALMSHDYVPCVFARPAGARTDLAILYVQDSHKLAGETVICTLAPSQKWITELDEGDIVHVRNRLRLGKDNDYLGDACPNNRQPSYGVKPELAVQTEIPPSTLKLVPDPEPSDSFSRIDTYLSTTHELEVFEKLASYCSRKHAANLLLSHGIRSLPVGAKELSAEQLHFILTL